MANQHDNHSNEKKPVSFAVPFIMAVVTLTVILLFVSMGDPCHYKCENGENCSKECMEACAKDDHNMHPAKEHGAAHSDAAPAAHGEEAAPAAAATESAPPH
jgi:hypothetical protein